MLDIQENVDIKEYSTLKIGGKFRYFVVIKDENDLLSLFSIIKHNDIYKDLPLYIIGSGSNIVFSDGIINRIFVKLGIEVFDIIKEEKNDVYIKVGAGVSWDDFVKKSIDQNFSGVEAMSIIPGTVGAGPVQNVGAYGVEVKDVLSEVVVYDLKENKIKNLLNEDCEFSYRDSIFKKEKGRYIILYVVYKLSKDKPKVPNYPDVLNYFKEKNINEPSLTEIREAIISIRNSKLPDFRFLPNVGSFFKNPIVLNEVAEKIRIEFPDVKLFKVGEDYTKIPAGWLIENAGLKGKDFGSISIYHKNALVLVNNGNATFSDLLNTKNEIIKNVEEKFGITLEQEPEII